MQLAAADRLVETALDAARRGGDALEALPVPVYVTDTQGWITAYNEACVEFVGRRPALGKDQCCGAWKFYSEAGEVLPRDRCPMAVSLAEKRAVRGAYAVAERPDGTRVTFTPFPTLLFDETGKLTGAVNVLIDVTDARKAAALRVEAEGCRKLAAAITDNARALNAMADECDAQAAWLEERQGRMPA